MAGLLEELTPVLIRAGGEVVKQAGIQFVRTLALQESVSRVETVSRPAAAPHGCPYCQVARSLSAAYRYLRRAETKPSLATLYQQLAAGQVGDARLAFETDPHASEYPEAIRALRVELEFALTELAHTLAHPVDMGQYGPLATETWRTSDIALDLAEYVNRPTEAPSGRL